MKGFLMAALAAAVIATGCLKNNEDEPQGCNYDPCKVVAPAAEIAGVKAYLDSVGISATQHCSGMFYAIDAGGTGAAPTVCSYISVKYKGQLKNGNVFDSVATASQYFALGNTITGWLNGIPLIKQGGSIRLYIPASLAYGSTVRTDQNGNVVIPANSMLIFNVQLEGVQ